MKLVYKPKPGFLSPGHGWPARNHNEPDERLAARKIASGFYRERGTNGAKLKGGTA